MKHAQKSPRTYKAWQWALAFGLIVLLNCCGFPVYNLTKEWPRSITLLYLALGLGYGMFAGGILAELLPERHWSVIALLSALLACGGLGCRFLLEFGEASNAYNFTLPNVALHLGAFVCLSVWSWQEAVKRARRAA